MSTIKYYNYRFVTFLTAVMTLIPAMSAARNDSLTKYRDSLTFFTTLIPAGWVVEDQTHPIRRLVAYPENKEIVACVYAYEVKGEVNIEKLMKNIPDLIGDMGEMQSKKGGAGYLERIYYDSDLGLYTKVWGKKNRSFGYLIVARSIQDDFTAADPVFTSFKAKVPIFRNYRNKIQGDFWVQLLAMITVLGSLLLWFPRKYASEWWSLPAVISVALGCAALIYYFFLVGMVWSVLAAMVAAAVGLLAWLPARREYNREKRAIGEANKTIGAYKTMHRDVL